MESWGELQVRLPMNRHRVVSWANCILGEHEASNPSSWVQGQLLQLLKLSEHVSFCAKGILNSGYYLIKYVKSTL